MKRSEVLKCINRIIEEHNEFDTNTADVLILDYIESIGMLPPYISGEEPFGFNEGYIYPPCW